MVETYQRYETDEADGKAFTTVLAFNREAWQRCELVPTEDTKKNFLVWPADMVVKNIESCAKRMVEQYRKEASVVDVIT